jgi:cell division FtsZ-interacting protein ZapD
MNVSAPTPGYLRPSIPPSATAQAPTIRDHHDFEIMDVGARADLKTEVLKDLEQKNMCWAAIAATRRYQM